MEPSLLAKTADVELVFSGHSTGVIVAPEEITSAHSGLIASTLTRGSWKCCFSWTCYPSELFLSVFS